MEESNNSSLETSAVEQTSNNEDSCNMTRRVGRVDRWLNKGFGFVTDLGRLDAVNTPNSGYGWLADEHTDKPVFIYHTALITSDEDTETFHRLFANEYVEYTTDFSQPQHDGRAQGYKVTGIAGSKLLCELNAASRQIQNDGDQDDRRSNSTRRRPQRGQRGERNNDNGQSRNQREHRAPRDHRQPRNNAPAASVQYIYYVPTSGGEMTAGTSQTVPPGGLAFPPLKTVQSEPNYVMPTNGIPIPK